MSEYTKLNFDGCFTDCGEPCNASLTVRHDPWQWPEGQILSNGEPSAVLNEETGLWTCEYPFLFVPGPPTLAHSFDTALGYVRFEQEATA